MHRGQGAPQHAAQAPHRACTASACCTRWSPTEPSTTTATQRGALYLHRDQAERSGGHRAHARSCAMTASRDRACSIARRRWHSSRFTRRREDDSPAASTARPTRPAIRTSSPAASPTLRRQGAELRTGTTIDAIETSGERSRRCAPIGGRSRPTATCWRWACYSPLLRARPSALDLPIYPIKGYSLTMPVGAATTRRRIGGVDENNLVAISPLRRPRARDRDRRVRRLRHQPPAGRLRVHARRCTRAVPGRRRLSSRRDMGRAAADDARQPADPRPQASSAICGSTPATAISAGPCAAARRGSPPI